MSQLSRLLNHSAFSVWGNSCGGGGFYANSAPYFSGYQGGGCGSSYPRSSYYNGGYSGFPYAGGGGSYPYSGGSNGSVFDIPSHWFRPQPYQTPAIPGYMQGGYANYNPYPDYYGGGYGGGYNGGSLFSTPNHWFQPLNSISSPIFLAYGRVGCIILGLYN
jgi:hypothetical protein